MKLPENSLIRTALDRVDYADVFEIDLGAAADRDIAALVRELFRAAPAWVRRLLALRDRVATRVGLKAAGDLSGEGLDRVSFEPGTAVGLFRVMQRSPDEIVLGEDDRHLDFRVSLLRRGSALVLSTVVRFHGALGRLYFLPVKPVHRRIVPAMLEALRGSLAGRAGR
jgi:hypothetical protein